jgi:hypothetical protein
MSVAGIDLVAVVSSAFHPIPLAAIRTSIGLSKNRESNRDNERTMRTSNLRRNAMVDVVELCRHRRQ